MKNRRQIGPAEADQRAALALVSRMARPGASPTTTSAADPERPVSVQAPDTTGKSRPPYIDLAHSLRSAIESGEIRVGEQLPRPQVIAEKEGVSYGTVQRAVAHLKGWGMVEVARGRSATVIASRALIDIG